MDRNIKSQATLEYIFVFSLSILFLFAIFFIFSDQVVKLNSDSKINEINDVGNFLIIELTTAQKVQNGYNKTFFLPEKIKGRDYEIILLEDDLLKISSGRFESFFKIPIFNGVITKGENNILKINNEIYVQ